MINRHDQHMVVVVPIDSYVRELQYPAIAVNAALIVISASVGAFCYFIQHLLQALQEPRKGMRTSFRVPITSLFKFLKNFRQETKRLRHFRQSHPSRVCQ